MYRTIDSAPSSSTSLAPDATRSFAELSRHARSLARLSANAALSASEATRSYYAALFAAPAAPADAWQQLVLSADRLIGVADAIARLDRLRPAEAAARDYFGQLVAENADLLDAAAAVA